MLDFFGANDIIAHIAPRCKKSILTNYTTHESLRVHLEGYEAAVKSVKTNQRQ